MAHFGSNETGTVMAVVIPYDRGRSALVGNGVLITTGPTASMIRIGAQLGFEVVDCTTVSPRALPYTAPGELYW